MWPRTIGSGAADFALNEHVSNSVSVVTGLVLGSGREVSHSNEPLPATLRSWVCRSCFVLYCDLQVFSSMPGRLVIDWKLLHCAQSSF